MPARAGARAVGGAGVGAAPAARRPRYDDPNANVLPAAAAAAPAFPPVVNLGGDFAAAAVGAAATAQGNRNNCRGMMNWTPQNGTEVLIHNAIHHLENLPEPTSNECLSYGITCEAVDKTLQNRRQQHVGNAQWSPDQLLIAAESFHIVSPPNSP